MVSPPCWKNMIVKFGSFPQVVVKIKNIWNHHAVLCLKRLYSSDDHCLRSCIYFLGAVVEIYVWIYSSNLRYFFLVCKFTYQGLTPQKQIICHPKLCQIGGLQIVPSFFKASNKTCHLSALLSPQVVQGWPLPVNQQCYKSPYRIIGVI